MSLLEHLDNTVVPCSVDVQDNYNQACIVKNVAGNRYDVYILGPIYELRQYIHLLSLAKSATSNTIIRVRINSPGGNVVVGMSICAALIDSKATIITENIGSAFSMGSGILMVGDKIAINEYTSTMFHNCMSGGRGDITAMRSIIDNTHELTEDILFKHSRAILTDDEMKAIREDGKELFLNSDEMISRLDKAGLLYKEVV